MKRIIALVLALLMLTAITVFFCSCEKAECTTCGKEHFVNSMEVTEILGQKIYTCKDCQEAIENLLK